jgi:hypothetical protein
MEERELPEFYGPAPSPRSRVQSQHELRCHIGRDAVACTGYLIGYAVYRFVDRQTSHPSCEQATLNCTTYRHDHRINRAGDVRPPAFGLIRPIATGRNRVPRLEAAPSPIPSHSRANYPQRPTLRNVYSSATGDTTRNEPNVYEDLFQRRNAREIILFRGWNSHRPRRDLARGQDRSNPARRCARTYYSATRGGGRFFVDWGVPA